jgi:hypothetical protein
MGNRSPYVGEIEIWPRPEPAEISLWYVHTYDGCIARQRIHGWEWLRTHLTTPHPKVRLHCPIIWLLLDGEYSVWNQLGYFRHKAYRDYWFVFSTVNKVHMLHMIGLNQSKGNALYLATPSLLYHIILPRELCAKYVTRPGHTYEWFSQHIFLQTSFKTILTMCYHLQPLSSWNNV